jgi:propanediol utilization protein
MKGIKIPIEVSARHIHLSKNDLEKIFGKGHELKKLKDLTQPCDFAAHETLEIRAGHKRIPNVRVVGPVRENTQVELSITDAVNLGLKPPVRISGDVKQSAIAFLEGSRGRVEIKEGVIIAQRHIHASTLEAKKLKLKDGAIVSVKISGPRETIFYNVLIRVRKDFKLCMHIDTDEGNAAGIDRRGEGEII